MRAPSTAAPRGDSTNDKADSVEDLYERAICGDDDQLAHADLLTRHLSKVDKDESLSADTFLQPHHQGETDPFPSSRRVLAHPRQHASRRGSGLPALEIRTSPQGSSQPALTGARSTGRDVSPSSPGDPEHAANSGSPVRDDEAADRNSRASSALSSAPSPSSTSSAADSSAALSYVYDWLLHHGAPASSTRSRSPLPTPTPRSRISTAADSSTAWRHHSHNGEARATALERENAVLDKSRRRRAKWLREQDQQSAIREKMRRSSLSSSLGELSPGERPVRTVPSDEFLGDSGVISSSFNNRAGNSDRQPRCRDGQYSQSALRLRTRHEQHREEQIRKPRMSPVRTRLGVGHSDGPSGLTRVTPLSMHQPSHSDDSSLSQGSKRLFTQGLTLQMKSFQTELELTNISPMEIDNGSTAQIYKAELAALNLTVALKVFPSVLNQTRRRLLRRELKIACRLVEEFRCDRIVPFIGTTEHGGRTVLVSQFMANGNILGFLKRNPDANRQTLILQVAEGVTFLHISVRLVHGDLKCENVLVTAEGTAVLADFGLSTTIDKSDGTTATGIRLWNTLCFAAPELHMDRARNRHHEHAIRSKTPMSDVYAFGMLVLQAFSGTRPWAGLEGPAIVAKVCAGSIPDRPGRNTTSLGLTDKWWGICLKCWRTDPYSRPSISRILRELRANARIVTGRSELLDRRIARQLAMPRTGIVA